MVIRSNENIDEKYLMCMPQCDLLRSDWISVSAVCLLLSLKIYLLE